MAAAQLNTFQQAPHAMLPRPTHDERSRQEFAKSVASPTAALAVLNGSLR